MRILRRRRGTPQISNFWITDDDSGEIGGGGSGEFGSRPRTDDVHRIIIHHSGGSTLAGALSTLKQRGLSYHYIIDTNGQYMNLVPTERVAYHAGGSNFDSVGICMVGNFLYTTPTDAQISTMKNLIRTVYFRYEDTLYTNVNQALLPHNAVSATACPAIDISEFRDYLYDLMHPEDSLNGDGIIYHKIEEIPDGEERDSVEWAMDRGYLKGEESGDLNLNRDLLRTIIILKRYSDDIKGDN